MRIESYCVAHWTKVRKLYFLYFDLIPSQTSFESLISKKNLTTCLRHLLDLPCHSHHTKYYSQSVQQSEGAHSEFVRLESLTRSVLWSAQVELHKKRPSRCVARGHSDSPTWSRLFLSHSRHQAHQAAFGPPPAGARLATTSTQARILADSACNIWPIP